MKWLRLPPLNVRKDRTKILGALLVLAGINFVVFLGVNLPRNRDLWRIGEEIRIWQTRIRQQERRVSGQRELLERAVTMRNQLDHFFDDRLSSKRNKMTRIMREVRSFAGKFRIDAESIQYRHKILEDQDLVLFEISIPLVGTYSSLRQFLQRVEGSDHFLIIDEINLTGSKEGGAQLSLRIRMSTYFSALETPLPSEERT